MPPVGEGALRLLVAEVVVPLELHDASFPAHQDRREWKWPEDDPDCGAGSSRRPRKWQRFLMGVGRRDERLLLLQRLLPCGHKPRQICGVRKKAKTFVIG